MSHRRRGARCARTGRDQAAGNDRTQPGSRVDEMEAAHTLDGRGRVPEGAAAAALVHSDLAELVLADVTRLVIPAVAITRVPVDTVLNVLMPTLRSGGWDVRADDPRCVVRLAGRDVRRQARPGNGAIGRLAVHVDRARAQVCQTLDSNSQTHRRKKINTHRVAHFH
eukprot:scaffold20494_cov69-Phaeocystis_antarctica.AAC.3